MFGVMSLYGYVTKRDLTRLGNLLVMALIGFFIASIVNFFLKSAALYWIVTYAGILIFIGSRTNTQTKQSARHENVYRPRPEVAGVAIMTLSIIAAG